MALRRASLVYLSSSSSCFYQKKKKKAGQQGREDWIFRDGGKREPWILSG